MLIFASAWVKIAERSHFKNILVQLRTAPLLTGQRIDDFNEPLPDEFWSGDYCSI